MSKTEMPAAEVNSYELAFHVLPTVAEGEVATVFQNLKDMIITQGGEIVTEEAPARIELAYEVVKHLEGRNRKFTSAYFGWVRFTVAPAAIAEITEVVEHTNELLRHLLTKLTKVEEENPFYFHEALAALRQKSEVIDVDAEASDEVETEADAEATEETEKNKETEVAIDGEESTDKV